MDGWMDGGVAFSGGELVEQWRELQVQAASELKVRPPDYFRSLSQWAHLVFGAEMPSLAETVRPAASYLATHVTPCLVVMLPKCLPVFLQ